MTPPTQKCAYLDCPKSLRNTPGLRRFKFPVNNPDRLEKWILNSGRTDLWDTPHKKIGEMFICHNHFEKKFFLSKKLSQAAVPICASSLFEASPATARRVYPGALAVPLPTISFSTEELRPSTSRNIDASSEPEFQGECKPSEFCTIPFRCMSPKPLSFAESSSERVQSLDIKGHEIYPEQIIGSPGPEINAFSNPKKINLKEKLYRTRQKLNRVLRVIKTKTLIGSLKQSISFKKPFVTMQLRHRLGTPWTSEEMNVAISLFYKSPTTYRFLRSRGCTLPSSNTIMSWVRNFKQVPGLNKRLLKLVQIKVHTMSAKSKECVLLFDEMAIKECLEFAKDKHFIEGFEDLGELGRRPVCAKQSLVFMVRGLYANWKIPLSFYFSENGVKAQQLFDLVIMTLNELKNIGLTPITIICKQSSTYQNLFKKLSITPENPYFFLEDRKYFVIFDPPEIIKCIRNNFLEGSFVLEDKIIQFSDIQDVYTLDKCNSTIKAMQKITDSHLNPSPLQETKVQLAAQLFSCSVAAAMKRAAARDKLKSPTAKNTAEFLEVVGNVYDTLNSRNFAASNPYKKPITSMNRSAIQALRIAWDVFHKLKQIDRTGACKRPPSFDSVLITVRAVELIFQTQRDKGYAFLLTSRLNLNALESQFSLYRQQSGYDQDPTVKEFQAAFQANLTENLLRPVKFSNYEAEGSSNSVETSRNVVTEMRKVMKL